MSRALLVLYGQADRARAIEWVEKAPAGTRVEFKSIKRSTSQNAKMWASLSDISEQVVWHGQKLKAEDWKFVFLDALKRELHIVPNIDGNGFVNLGRSSSDLTKQEMADLLTLIEMFGASHGVKFHDQREEAAA
jgi:hypothetical protein